MSFPSGLLRWTGEWSATQQYRYGDIALASTNVSYACGVPTSLNNDPATQPSDDWFPFPSSGGGSPSTWSQYPASQDVNMDGNRLLSKATDPTAITLLDDITLTATVGDGHIYLLPSATGFVAIEGKCGITGPLGVDTITNLNNAFGSENQQLTSDGTKIQWYSPTMLENQVLAVSTPISTTGTTLLTSVTQADRPSSSAFITVSINYKATAGGQNNLSFDLKYLIGAGPSTSLDEVNVTSIGNGDLGSCSLCGVISGILPTTNLQVILTATGDGVGHFSVERASMVVMYNMAPQV